jgi:hypothetical protein
MRIGDHRLYTSTQGEYTKSKPAFEKDKDLNGSKQQSQILSLRTKRLVRDLRNPHVSIGRRVIYLCNPQGRWNAPSRIEGIKPPARHGVCLERQIVCGIETEELRAQFARNAWEGIVVQFFEYRLEDF